MYEDKTLVCKECGKEFVFTAGEQEFYAERGFQNEPQRCKACRDARKNSARGPREYFTATCAACGGALTLRRTDPRLADPVLNALTESGCRISCSHDTIQIFRDSPLATCGPVVSRPYPGFPTDAMPMLLWLAM